MYLREYGCIMLDYKMPAFMKEISNSIDKDDVYKFGSSDYAITPKDECHVTIAYGLELDIKYDDIKKYLYTIDKYQTLPFKVDIFENEEFDVLKVDVACPMANKSFNEIKENFKLHTEYLDFKPHMTIAYMKKGKAKKYLTNNILDKLEVILPYRFNWSYVDENGKDKNDYYH